MERFSEGLRSPLLFWECILVPAELINYKPNILLANWLWNGIFVWDKWRWRNCSRACIKPEDCYYRILPCQSLLKLSWYIILKYFRVYFHSLLIALICIIIYLRIAHRMNSKISITELCSQEIPVSVCRLYSDRAHVNTAWDWIISTIYYLLRTTHQYTAAGMGSWWLVAVVAQYAECCYIVKYYQSHFKVDMLIHDNNSTSTASGAATQSWGRGDQHWEGCVFFFCLF